MIDALPLLRSHFVTEPCAEGLTWTLATRIGEILSVLKSRYGVIDGSWTFLGVEFRQGGPRIYYPGEAKFKHVVMQLSINAASYLETAVYEAAHECVHLLAPSGGRLGTVLEEGLATHFSEAYFLEKFGRPSKVEHLSSYARAAERVDALLAIDADAIAKLRNIQPKFDEISNETFAEAGLCAVPQDLRAELLAPFMREQS